MRKRDTRRKYTAYVTAALVGGVVISSVHTASALDVVTDPAQTAMAQETLPQVTVEQDAQQAMAAAQTVPAADQQTDTQVQAPVETPVSDNTQGSSGVQESGSAAADVPSADAGDSSADVPDGADPGMETPAADENGQDISAGSGTDADAPSGDEADDDVTAGEGTGQEVPDGDGQDASAGEAPDAETPSADGDDQSFTTGNEPDMGGNTEDGTQPDAGPAEPDADADGGETAEGPGNGETAPVTIVDQESDLTVQPSQTIEPDAEETVVPQFYWDNSADAYYEERDYDPSEKFVEDGEKIKYSTDMPLENIPAFITPEMIIGALKVQDVYGYPASVTIAQIIQESGFGVYGPYGDEGQGLSYLAYQYNNLFGVKGTGPAGSVNMATGEQTASGARYTINAGFRVYHTYTEAIEDRAELLTEVYGDLIEGVTDANTFAMRIGSRWATDINYSRSLIRQMETYDLYRLDRMTLGEFSELLGDFADPCPGAQVTSEFGWREFRNSYHKGIDLGTGNENIPTYAAAAGTVIVAGWSDSAGNWVVIDHGDGMITKYMHHKEIYVEVGDKVEKGQQIGLSGTTGDSTGNHLHFQLEINGAAVDPAPYLFSDEDETEQTAPEQ